MADATCDPLIVPKVSISFCAPEINFGRVDKIYFTGGTTPFTDWTVITEWNTRLDNDDIADADKIRTLNVIGSKPAAEGTVIEFSLGRKAGTEKTHTIPVKVDETNDDNYALVRWLDDNQAIQVCVWYQIGKHLYGGNTGVLGTLTLNEVAPESDKELVTYEGSVVFDGKHPERTVNPLA